jgi:hypothetical protein
MNEVEQLKAEIERLKKKETWGEYIERKYENIDDALPKSDLGNFVLFGFALSLWILSWIVTYGVTFFIPAFAVCFYWLWKIVKYLRD